MEREEISTPDIGPEFSIDFRQQAIAQVHVPIATGSGRRAARHPVFRWVNTMLGNIKSAITGTYRAIRKKAYRRKNTAIPLSLSMPLSVAEHGDKAVTPYMWGQLPDNDGTLASLGRHFGVNPRNPFSLLSAIGEDLQGAVQRFCRTFPK